MAAQLGYCGVDRRRLPLSGSELRGCWAAGPVRSADAAPATEAPDVADLSSPALRLRDFVPVELIRRDPAVTPVRKPVPGGQPALTAQGEPRPDSARTWADPVTLFVDADL